MTDDKGPNDQIEELRKELEDDLLFYLRMYNELSKRGKRMKAVLDKEIEELEERLKELG
jgi:hypothetical protein